MIELTGRSEGGVFIGVAMGFSDCWAITFRYGSTSVAGDESDAESQLRECGSLIIERSIVDTPTYAEEGTVDDATNAMIAKRDDTRCRGSFALGTACGECARCEEELENRGNPT